MSFGRHGTFPLRFGQSSGRNLELLEKTYLQAHGSAFDTVSLDGYLACESLAVARVLAESYDTIKCFANQSNPNKLTVHLERWESIFKVVPRPDDTESERRGEIVRRVTYLAKPCTKPNLDLFLIEALGDMFIRVEFEDSALATGVVSVPGGLDLSPIGGTTISDGNYSSSMCTIRIILDDSVLSAADFERYLKRLTLLDDWFPAWVEWHWTLDDYWTLDTGPGLDEGALSG